MRRNRCPRERLDRSELLALLDWFRGCHDFVSPFFNLRNFGLAFLPSVIAIDSPMPVPLMHVANTLRTHHLFLADVFEATSLGVYMLKFTRAN